MAVLLGRQSASTTVDFNAAGNNTAWKFTAVASGGLVRLWAQTQTANATATAVSLSVWDDTAGGARPGAQLGIANADVLASARGAGLWSATLATPVAITSGTAYWLAWGSSTEQWDFKGDTSGSYVESDTNPIVTPWPSAGNVAGTINVIIWGESAGGNVLISPLPFMSNGRI